ncbi:MAG: monovalent cation:proton antiporter-2 (CPA2) family protein [Pseudomonadota bacterium]
MLANIALLLAAAVLFVPFFRRLGLGAVLGYLAAGITIGPSGFGLIGDARDVLRVAEFGVVLLLFIIGLELQPSRLWTLRRMVFGLGGAQVLLTGAALMAAGIGLGLDWRVALIVGFALAMSSTAFALQMLAERKELATQHGRAAFATLLFQDVAVIPLLALIPLLSPYGPDAEGPPGWIETLKTLAVFALVFLGGRYAVRPLMRLVASAEMPELLTGAALLIVIGTALAMDAVGLSMSLGAFLAGVLLSDFEYRHQLRAEIEPFKGILLGLFFIAVGMSADLRLLLSQPVQLLLLVAGLLLVKATLLYVLGRAARLPAPSALALAMALPQGGEFAFIVFTTAVAAGLMSPERSAELVVVVTLSMIATPALYALQARLQRSAPRPYDQIDAGERSVIIAGFGPVGQIVARILRVKQIPFTVLDKDSQQVDFVRRFGNTVFYGDASRIDLLRAAQAHKARLFVLTIPDIEASLQVARVVRRNFPQLRIFAIAVNRMHALRLMDMGITDVVRRSFFSSLEMTRDVLVALGGSEDDAQRTIDTFRRHDEALLKRQQALAHDEKLLIESSQDAARELEQLFEQDPRQR